MKSLIVVLLTVHTLSALHLKSMRMSELAKARKIQSSAIFQNYAHIISPLGNFHQTQPTCPISPNENYRNSNQTLITVRSKKKTGLTSLQSQESWDSGISASGKMIMRTRSLLSMSPSESRRSERFWRIVSWLSRLWSLRAGKGAWRAGKEEHRREERSEEINV